MHWAPRNEHFKAFWGTLRAEDTVLLPNARMATLFQHRWGRALPDPVGWIPQFVSWEAWLTRLWEHLMGNAMVPQRLDPLVTWTLWHDEVGTREWTTECMAIWSRFQDFGVSWSVLADEPEEACQFLVAKCRLYEQCCQDLHAIDDAGLAPYLLSVIQEGTLDRALGTRIFWVNFDDMIPIQKALMMACQRRGVKTDVVNLNNPEQAVVHQWVFEHPHVEQSAHWRRLFETRPEPGNQRAWVVLDLKKEYRAIRRLVSAYMAEQGLDPADLNISSGTPLSHEPIIQSALMVLGTALGPWRPALIRNLIRSPFVRGADREMLSRAQIALALAGAPERDMGADDLRLLFKPVPLFQQAFEKSREWSEKNAPRVAQDFLPFCQQLLEDWGWPNRSLGSRAYQAINLFWGLFDRLVDWPLGRWRLEQGLALLKQAADERLFQPESRTHAPFQILGWVESMGLPFESLSISGLTASVFPAKPAPQPFVPVAWQKKWGWPHASAARELEFAQKALGSWRSRSRVLALSFPKTVEGDLQWPSPLLDRHDFLSGPLEEKSVRVPVLLEKVSDNAGCPLPADRQKPLKKGVSFLKAQAQCPFQAYVRFRLGVEPLPERVVGLDPRVRGQMRHHVLQEMAALYTDNEQLAHVSEEIARSHIQTVLAAYSEHLIPTLTVPQATWDLECLLIEEEIIAWLDFEKTRTPFTVLHREQEHHLIIEDMMFRLRTDRMDAVDGVQVVMDYKMRAPAVHTWFADRLTEPQMPLYAFLNEAIGGVFYANISEPALKGCAEVVLKEGMKTVEHFAGVKEAWRQSLAVLMTEIKSGHAAVSPHGEEACRFCALGSVCRVNAS